MRVYLFLVATILLAATAPACGKSGLAPATDETSWDKVIAAEGYFDGPYILYEGNHAKVIRVEPGEGGAVGLRTA